MHEAKGVYDLVHLLDVDNAYAKKNIKVLLNYILKLKYPQTNMYTRSGVSWMEFRLIERINANF